jgi:hypothetical protein
VKNKNVGWADSETPRAGEISDTHLWFPRLFSHLLQQKFRGTWLDPTHHWGGVRTTTYIYIYIYVCMDVCMHVCIYESISIPPPHFSGGFPKNWNFSRNIGSFSEIFFLKNMSGMW